MPGVADGSHSLGCDGRIAQLVEQLTLNQRVVGSRPTAPTIASNEFNELKNSLLVSLNSAATLRTNPPFLRCWSFLIMEAKMTNIRGMV
jgi:hypothetical protein